MASIQTQTASFQAECWQAIHNLLTDTINIALYTNVATLDASTTVYSSTNEITGTGYVSGGQALAGALLSTSAKGAYLSFNNASWTGTLTARYALIYNASKENRAVAVIDFGGDKTSVITFVVQMPPHTSTTALLRSTT